MRSMEELEFGFRPIFRGRVDVGTGSIATGSGQSQVRPCPLLRRKRKYALIGCPAHLRHLRAKPELLRRIKVICLSPFAKIFRWSCRANHLYKLAPSCPTRGALRNVINAGWDAVDAGSAQDGSGGLRTAKSCGSDASTPASSQRWQHHWRR
jgi:hypothetical protein